MAQAANDWLWVAELAPRIANQPAPPLSENMRVFTRLGTDARKFRGFDKQLHDAGVATGDAASRGDGEAVIAAFAKVQQGVLRATKAFGSVSWSTIRSNADPVRRGRESLHAASLHRVAD